MNAVEINLIDSHFAHSEFAVPGVASDKIVWHRDHPSPGALTVITHEDMYRYDYAHLPKASRFGLLLESQSVIPRVYSRAEGVIPDYELVFTHSERLLNRFSNTRWIPGGGIWVGGRHAGGAIEVAPKTRMVSMLTSNKLQTALHRRRYFYALLLQRTRPEIDVFRQKLRSRETISVFETLREYRYSIVIENYIDDRYFTEKVLNCFATGTVPIYLGARRLGDYFDDQGFLAFRNWTDLRDRVLPLIGVHDYLDRLPAIYENLDRALQFRSVEDFIYDNYLKERATES